jgi:hypothetical protein
VGIWELTSGNLGDRVWELVRENVGISERQCGNLPVRMEELTSRNLGVCESVGVSE